MWLAVRYLVFAAVATLANIALQDVATRVYAGPFSVPASMAVGTLAGLVFKYLLDKRYIFHYRTSGAVEDGRLFVLYSAMGVITTLVFWGTELGFDYAFGTKSMRYIGGVLGLALGYWIKYRLDRRFVFAGEEH